MFEKLENESGITNPMEIAREFIKNQDQKQQLYNYLRLMSSEKQQVMDKIEKSVKEEAILEKQLELQRENKSIAEKTWNGLTYEQKIHQA